MTRFTVIALLLASLAVSVTGCTNTVRGLGRDFNSDTLQNYNSRTATNLDY
jgi:predicted small secreted protein